MPVITKNKLVRWSKRCALAIAVISLTGVIVVAGLWSDRPRLSDVNWPAYPATETPGEMAEGTVTVTWLGVTTLLFDDGETQILIDGFISRPSIIDILLRRLVVSDAANINFVMNEYRMRRIAAIIPIHSHYDHAMDIGAIANRSFASILGSSSTVQIARGAGVPEDQIILATNRTEYPFGKFTVTLIDSVHAPSAWRGEVPVPGEIEQPLKAPAPITAWREGHSYSIVIAHPSGTTLVQGSAGFIEEALGEIRADVVMLGIGQLAGIGRDYAERYWQEVVTKTGAKRVFPIHFDDYTKPFGTVEPFPRVVDNFVKMAGWLKAFRDTWDTDTRLQVPVFGKAIVLYPPDPPDA